MSSSPPRSRRSLAGPCPSCGGRRVVSTQEAIVLRVGRRKFTLVGAPHERCLACGERIFGYEASRRMDELVLRGGRARAA